MNHPIPMTVAAGIAIISAGAAVPIQPESDYESTPKRQSHAGSTFDESVRGDFFRGLLENDAAAWQEARKTIDTKLGEDAENGEAMAWLGAMLVADAEKAFAGGDVQKGMQLWNDGITSMDRGVELDKTVNSMIPRGITLFQVYRYEPDLARQIAMLDTAIGDLQYSLDYLTPVWDTQSKHARGMLLLMLADANAQRAERDAQRALELRTRILNEMPGTSYAARARNAMEKARTVAADAPASGTPTSEQLIIQWLVEVLRLADVKTLLPDEAVAAVASAGGPEDAAWSEVSAMLSAEDAEPIAESLAAFAGIMRSFDLFASGDFQNAMPLWNESQASLERSASEYPRDRGVAACRAAAYLLAYPYQRDPREQARMAEAATGDADKIARWLTRSAADADTRAKTDVIRAMAAEASGQVDLAQELLRAAILPDAESPAAAYASTMLQRLGG
ncbi:MAG: hypothetical protein AAGH71_06055 [Planctomycetota bacterium]